MVGLIAGWILALATVGLLACGATTQATSDAATVHWRAGDADEVLVCLDGLQPCLRCSRDTDCVEFSVEEAE